MTPAVVRTRAELREIIAARRAQAAVGFRVGLVPTMGALHEGHLSLIRAAAEACDLVVVSVFVNPTQFGPGEDLDRYPRDEARDAELAGAAGADLIYAPAAADVYPDGFATTVSVDRALTGVLCGDPRRRGPGHFDGVTTVVAKLLAAVGPDVAFFGQKDAQQAVVIRRMVHDLELPVEIQALPIVREPDGLALSSRNAYLSPAERNAAPVIHRALLAAAERAADPDATAGDAVEAVRAALATEELVDPEYVEARDAEDLAPVTELGPRPVLIAIAARIGDTRLIDNVVVAGRPSQPPAAAPAPAQPTLTKTTA